MTYVLDVFDGEGDYESRSFKTLRGAVNAGMRALKKQGHEVYGYLAANRYEGEAPFRRHIVAEWKDHGRQLARVWS